MESVFYESEEVVQHEIQVGDALKYPNGVYIVTNDYGLKAHGLMKLGASSCARTFSSLGALRAEMRSVIKKGDVIHYPSDLYQLDIQITPRKK